MDDTTAHTSPSHRERWREEIAAAVRDPDILWTRLRLPRLLLPAGRRAAEAFPLLAPEPLLRRIRPGDPDDPILRQILPLGAELEAEPGFTADPLQEAAQCAGTGLLHKYAGRSLIVATGACAVHCRYCFRRHFPYAGEAGWRSALEQLPGDAEEVILSGGDPLTLDDEALEEFFARAADHPSVQRLRMHTRMPVAVPSRVTERLLEAIAASHLPVVVVVHANHPAEIDDETERALNALESAARAVLNQSVLLRGVNDDADCLAALSRRLFDAGCLPYYLHLLDPVDGAAHFQIDDTEARRIAAETAARLPGYMVPRLVREHPGASAKTVITPRL